MALLRVQGLRILTGQSRDHLIYTQMAMAAMDSARGLNGSISGYNVKAAGTAALIAALGVAGPPKAARALDHYLLSTL